MAGSDTRRRFQQQRQRGVAARAKGQAVLAYPLYPKQMQAMDAIWIEEVDQLLYGGSAGGGKSQVERALAYHCAHVWPGARIPIFRENYSQLLKTQVAAFHKEMGALGYEIADYWSATTGEWRIPNPYTSDTIIEFLHIDQSIGAEKWLSAEWACLEVDEATQISQENLEMLYTRVRASREQRELWRQLADEREAQAKKAGLTDPKDIKRARSDWHPFAVFATNPGGKSHDYFKEQFVDERAKHGGPWTTQLTIEVDGKDMDVGLKREFVQAFVTDNPAIDASQYARGLAHLPKRRREQLLSGNWSFFEGKTFDMLTEETHLIDARWPFHGQLVPPREWPRLGGLDHGTTSPTAAEWMTRDEDGFFILGYLEYYSPGPNALHIKGIRELLQLDGRLDLTFEADPRMYYKNKGHDRVWSVADEFAFGGEPPLTGYDREVARRKGIVLHQSQAERVPSRHVMQRLLETNDDLIFPDWHPRAGEHGAPRMFICRQAPNLWRELNLIRQADPPNDEETVKENDHGYDAAYRVATMFEQLLMSRPRSGAVIQIGYR